MTEALKPKLSVGYGTGTPSGMPDYRPMNPWGRPMPKPSREPRPALWQIMVKVDGKRIPMGPRMEKQAIEAVYHDMNKIMIETSGKVWWAEPEMVCMDSGGGEKPSSALRVRW